MLAWFRTHQRDLPWRRSRDPYRIWVAEVMLQQTRIAAVMPYYQRFLARFPTVQSLARAHEAEVLKLWSGLGYYSRARNLHRAAKDDRHSAQRKISARTRCRARTSWHRHLHRRSSLEHRLRIPLAVLDGNVARVLARINAIRGDLRAPESWRALTATAQNCSQRKPPAIGISRSWNWAK